MRLKDFSVLNPQYKGESLDCEVSFVPMESLRNGAIDYQDIPFAEGKGKYTYFQDGDLLVAKVTPCFENGNIAIANNMKQGVGFGSSEIFVLRMNDKVLNTYMFYITQTAKFQEEACATMCGVGGLKRISPLFMRTYELDIPSLSKQQRIVDYLDAELGKIDARIAVLEKEQDAYARLKRSVIHHAVTRGLNPNISLKDSGVEWIGMIPEHWETKRIKDVVSDIFTGVSPVYEYENDNQNYVFGQRNNQEYGIDFEGIKYAKDDFFKTRLPKEFLKYGDVLLNTLGGGSVGRTGYYYIEDNISVITDGHVMIIRSKTYNTRYMYYYLCSRKERLEMMAIGSTNQAFFNISDIRLISLPMPSLEEQQVITAYLDEKCPKIDAATENIGKQIDALKRLKRALINEVVTGQRAV